MLVHSRYLSLVCRAVLCLAACGELGLFLTESSPHLDFSTLHFCCNPQAHATTHSSLFLSIVHCLLRSHLFFDLADSEWTGTLASADLLESITYSSCSLSASEQRELQSRMERKQMKEFMTVRKIEECQSPCGWESRRLKTGLTQF